MDIKNKKNIFLNKLRNENTIKGELKEEFEKQIEKMDDEEFVVFFESIAGVKDEEDLKEKIVKTREMQTKEHKNFLQSASDFLGKIMQNESRKQTGRII